MNSSIILFDLKSGNVMEDFASESDAWDALREMADDHGLEAIEDLSLLHMREGQPTLIAMEDELVQRVARELSPETVGSKLAPLRQRELAPHEPRLHQPSRRNTQ